MKELELQSIIEQKNHFGIYCIECIPTKVKYIGQTHENFYRRWTFHKWHLNNNHHSNTYLQNAYNKYGSDNFIFYPIQSFNIQGRDVIGKDTLDELEVMYIKQFDTFNNGFNLTTGGNKCKMKSLSEAVKKSIGSKNRVHMLGRKHSEETKRLMSESHKGYRKTTQHRKNLSKALTGYKRSEEQKEKCRLANQGSKQKTAIYNEEIVGNMRIDYMNGMPQKMISEKYGVKQSTLYGILHHTRWKHVVPSGWIDFLNKAI